MENFLLLSGFFLAHCSLVLRFSSLISRFYVALPRPRNLSKGKKKPSRIIRNGNCWFTSQPLKLHLQLDHVARDIGGGDHHLVALQVRVPLLCREDPIVSIGVQLGISFFDPPDLPPLLRMTIGLLDSRSIARSNCLILGFCPSNRTLGQE
jgi:hypothetical protein